MEEKSHNSSKSNVGKATTVKSGANKSFMEFHMEASNVNKSMHKLKSKKKPNYAHVKSRVYEFRNNDLGTQGKGILSKSI